MRVLRRIAPMRYILTEEEYKDLKRGENPVDNESITSKMVFQRRFYDSQSDCWSDWEELGGCDLLKYDDTFKEWRSIAKFHIKMGYFGEYRTIVREETAVWNISF